MPAPLAAAGIEGAVIGAGGHITIYPMGGEIVPRSGGLSRSSGKVRVGRRYPIGE